MRNSLDPIYVVYRPLMYYLSAIMLDYISQYILYFSGFTFGYAGSLRYYYKPKKQKRFNKIDRNMFKVGNDQFNESEENLSPDPLNNNQPVVYIHGIGYSLLFNLPIIFSMAKDREIFVVELPWISNRLGEIIPTPEDFVTNIEFMLVNQGLWTRGACFVGHSYGTIAITWVLTQRP